VTTEGEFQASLDADADPGDREPGRFSPTGCRGAATTAPRGIVR
jgi:hypothetical protein